MSDVAIALGVGVLAFVFGIIGLLLQPLLPERHMTGGSRDMINAVIGLITLLLALVLGTLVGSAYGFFALQKSNVETLDARAIQLDLALAQFGPETQPIRAGLKAAIVHAYDTFWKGGKADPKELSVDSYLPGLKHLNDAIAELNPQTPIQRQAIGAIGFNASALVQTRLLMSLQLASSVSWPLLIIVVSWAVLLFCGFGVISRYNATSIGALALGSFAVASAIFLILELNAPFTGLVKVPPASVEETINALG